MNRYSIFLMASIVLATAIIYSNAKSMHFGKCLMLGIMCGVGFFFFVISLIAKYSDDSKKDNSKK